MFNVRLLVFLLLCAQPLTAQMPARAGLIAARSLPAPTVSDKLVLLDVPHMRQRAYLCVPTSAAMIMAYYGKSVSPTDLKSLAEGHKPMAKRERKFTYWADMQVALARFGKSWSIQSFENTDQGFRKGFAAMRKSLRDKRPVMIDIDAGGGHTFVVIGYNDADQLVYIRDPATPSHKARALTYAELRRHWHGSRFSPYRNLFLSSP